MPDSAPLSTARKANPVEPNVTARDVTTGSFPSSRKVHLDAPDALSADWDELVDVLMKKGIKAEK